MLLIFFLFNFKTSIKLLRILDDVFENELVSTLITQGNQTYPTFRKHHYFNFLINYNVNFYLFFKIWVCLNETWAARTLYTTKMVVQLLLKAKLSAHDKSEINF